MTRKIKPSDCDREHEFAFILDATTPLSDEAELALFNAGCDDATVSVRSGRVYMTFSRRAPTLEEAIISALGDVHKSNIGVAVLRVDVCNLVTQADIARRTGRSRQQIHQYMTGKRGPGGFPAPACNLTDGVPLWYWCEVAHWLWTNSMVTEEVLKDAQGEFVINSVLEYLYNKRANSELANRVEAVCGTCRQV